MTRKHGAILSGIVLAFGFEGSFAGETWLMIASDPPGAVVAVDGTYHGVTPQHLEDVLRIQVSEGIREIDAHLRLGGKDYTAKQVVNAQVDRENPVQINLREETARASDAPTAPPAQAGKPPFGTVIPVGELEVPGRNF